MRSGFPVEQLFDAAEERLAGQVGVAQATGGLGAVAQHHVVPAGILRRRAPERASTARSWRRSRSAVPVSGPFTGNRARPGR